MIRSLPLSVLTQASHLVAAASLFSRARRLVIMGTKSIRRLVVVLLAIVLMGLFLVDSSAQRRRRRTRPRRTSTPRISTPAIYKTPATDEENTKANSACSEATHPTNADS